MRRRAVLTALAAACLAAPAAAQTTSLEIPPPVLTIDGERLFSDTAYGRALLTEVEAAARELAAENREIEAALTAEERELTDRRPDLPPEEFRALADAFDAKVQRIRAEQDEKTRSISQLRDEGRQRFFGQIGPVVSDIVRERGALIVLERRDVFLSAESIDITDEAIRRIDERLGSDLDGAAGTPEDGGDN